MSEEAKGKRPYVIECRQADGAMIAEYLIDSASSPSQAVRQYVGERYTARAASAKDVMRLMRKKNESLANVEYIPVGAGGGGA